MTYAYILLQRFQAAESMPQNGFPKKKKSASTGCIGCDSPVVVTRFAGGTLGRLSMPYRVVIEKSEKNLWVENAVKENVCCAKSPPTLE